MRGPIEIENIEERRREAGIDDAELREQIRRLAVGDCVLLTLLNPIRVFADQTLRVRITRIRGSSLRGKVVGKPARAGSPRPPPGTQLAFTTAHIHSVPEPARVTLPEGVADLDRPASARPSSPRPCPGQSVKGRKGLLMPPKPTPSRPPPAPCVSAPARAAQDPPLSTAEHLQRIAALGRQVAEYVEFMAQVGGLSGTSAEARDRAVAAFYERLTVLEGQLARIYEELRLG
jgi:hypothetical protein